MSGLPLDAMIGLHPWVRLRHDPVRGKDVLLAPEKVLFPCPTSVMILGRLGQGRPLLQVVDELAAEFEAPRDEILADVQAMLGGLAAEGCLRIERAGTSHD